MIAGIDFPLPHAEVTAFIGDWGLCARELAGLIWWRAMHGSVALARELLRNGMDVYDVQILIAYLGG